MTKTGICDRCTAEADADVYLTDGRLLELCDSHALRHLSALQRQGALVIGRLLVGEPAPANPYEGIAFEREFRRLSLAATDRPPKRLTGGTGTWTKLWRLVSRPRPPARRSNT
jgi:hypothetical protein